MIGADAQPSGTPVGDEPRSGMGSADALRRVGGRATRLTRRKMIGLSMALAACGPAPPASPSKAPAPPAAGENPAMSPAAQGAASTRWQDDWEQTLAAANREGKVVITVGAGNVYRDHALEFQRKYPEISMEVTAGTTVDLLPRILSERRAGQYLWDVFTGPATYFQLRDDGGFDPLKPALILPEILDDRNWRDGFDAGFHDTAKQHLYGHTGRMYFMVYVNRDIIPESELNSIEQLLDPKWRGQIVSADPRVFSVASAHAAYYLLAKGEDWLRRLLAQDLVVTGDVRQLIEFVIRGRYPIGFGVFVSELERFQREGTGQSVQPLAPRTELGARYTTALGSVALMNRAPHPNAAKVFINWLLGREAQESLVKLTTDNSRRLDVPGPPETVPPPGAYLKDVNREDNMATITHVFEIAKEILR
jgi:iron(III) transport system substrate-binding protein